MNRARDAASVLHRLPFPERPLVLRGCKVQDKSLGIELSALKQALWINGVFPAGH